MDDEVLLKVTNSMEEKLGKDTSAMIADDIGLLISENEKTLKTLKEKDAKIEKLKADKEKLVLANGNLLRQIPMGEEEIKESVKTEEASKPINLKDAFTGNGMFKH